MAVCEILNVYGHDCDPMGVSSSQNLFSKLFNMAINKPQVAVKLAGEWRTASIGGLGFGFPRSVGSGDNKTRPGIPACSGLIRRGKCQAGNS
jgi:hypothetical protein